MVVINSLRRLARTTQVLQLLYSLHSPIHDLRLHHQTLEKFNQKNFVNVLLSRSEEHWENKNSIFFQNTKLTWIRVKKGHVFLKVIFFGDSPVIKEQTFPYYVSIKWNKSLVVNHVLITKR